MASSVWKWIVHQVFSRPRIVAPSDFKLLLMVASGHAHLRGDPQMRPADLLLAALLHDEVVDLIKACEADPAALRLALQRHLQELAAMAPAGAPRPGINAPPVEVSPEAATILRHTHRWAGPQGVSPVDVLRAILWVNSDDFVTALLEGAGVRAQLDEMRPRDRAKTTLPVEVTAVPYRRAPGPRLVPVVLWNDSKSTMEGVIRVLVECFEMEQIEALHVMVTVHHVGQATVRHYPEEEARLVAERALTLARSLGMPLRITTATDVPS